MRGLVRESGLEEEIRVESAGTGSWHVGEPPDPRSAQAAAARGVEMTGTARQVRRGDFADFDLLLAMDRTNHDVLRDLAPDDDARARVRLLREFDPASAAAGDLDVPDPYFGGADGFDHVLDLVEAACRGLLDELRGGDRR